MHSQRFYFPSQENRLYHHPSGPLDVHKALPGTPPRDFPPRVSLEKSGRPHVGKLDTYSQRKQNAEIRSPSRANVPREAHTVSGFSLTPHDSKVVLPSRLRYAGVQVTKGMCLGDFQGAPTARFHQQDSSQGILDPQKIPKVPDTFPLNYESVRAALLSSVDPLLQQALLLMEAAEVEERLTLRQEEVDAFESIMALFSVAREVEEIRVAAFEMFHYERAYRRAVKRQERDERQILRLWYSGSYRDAQLSEEVRIIRRESEEPRDAFRRSLLRSRSASLQQQSSHLFEMGASGITTPSSTPLLLPQNSGKHCREALLFSSELGRQEGDRGVFPDSFSQEPYRFPRALSPNPTVSHFSRPLGSSPPLGSPSDSVNIADKRQYYHDLDEHRQRSLRCIEAELEDRILRQEALLLPATLMNRSSCPSLLN
ncbi:hypothetical protein JKF63_03308 [Porcisia hertigi]|uniref:Uncharacterized protein n=1 Tax=Porcisia hertigi TaxID=2761500 RepID=A0A836HYD9_9TRYP|nr:hypothetical protein JKF63_03308 [Porcisia hertigi]